MERTLKDHSKMLEFIMTNLHPKTMEKMKKEFDESNLQSKSSQKKEDASKDTQIKTRIMHDDITVKCPQCKSISTVHEKNCKECGHKI